MQRYIADVTIQGLVVGTDETHELAVQDAIMRKVIDGVTPSALTFDNIRPIEDPVSKTVGGADGLQATFNAAQDASDAIRSETHDRFKENQDAVAGEPEQSTSADYDALKKENESAHELIESAHKYVSLLEDRLDKDVSAHFEAIAFLRSALLREKNRNLRLGKELDAMRRFV